MKKKWKILLMKIENSEEKLNEKLNEEEVEY